MASIQANVHLEVGVDVEHLNEFLEQVDLIEEMVPEWYQTELDEIHDNMAGILKQILTIRK